VTWRRVFCILAMAAAMTPLPGCQKEGTGAGTSGSTSSSGPVPTAVEAQPPMAFLDTPAEGAVGGGTARVVGWALDPSGIAQVNAAVDGQSGSSAALGMAHPGVAEAHPGIPGNDRAGFAIEIPGLQKGSHSLTVTVIARSGGKTEIRRRFEVQ
jgi:hypothetical protein